jgi:hypothetical protein
MYKCNAIAAHIAEKNPENFVDGWTDGQTARQMGIKPIVTSGYTGRGLIKFLFDFIHVFYLATCTL